MASFFDNWTIQVRKGILELCILNALETGECYGYALVKQLVSIPGLHVAEGTIYPLLSRLKQQGLVATRLEESPDGPGSQILQTHPHRKQRTPAHEHLLRRLVRSRRYLGHSCLAEFSNITMTTWTPAAESFFREFIASHFGARPADEVAQDLRCHVHEELTQRGVSKVTRIELERVMDELNPDDEIVSSPAWDRPKPVDVRASDKPASVKTIAAGFFYVVLPTIVILLESIFRWCAAHFFDPVPTVFHALLLLAVPCTSGWLLWKRTPWQSNHLKTAACPFWPQSMCRELLSSAHILVDTFRSIWHHLLWFRAHSTRSPLRLHRKHQQQAIVLEGTSKRQRKFRGKPGHAEASFLESPFSSSLRLQPTSVGSALPWPTHRTSLPETEVSTSCA